MKTFIEIRFQVKGLHCWPDAPEAVAFLRNPHRHTFHFRVRIAVQHADRDIEFIMFRDKCREAFAIGDSVIDFGTKSCEQLAYKLYEYLHKCDKAGGLDEIGVSEDGEFEGILKW